MSEQQPPSEKSTITFGRAELAPEELQSYREKIRAASTGVGALKGSDPVRPPRPLAGGTAIPRQANQPPAPTEGVQPRPAGSPMLRQETVQQLNQATAAARVQQEEAVVAETKKELEGKKEDLFDLFDFDSRNEAEKILNNKKRRAEIEGRCEPMSLEDLIMRDEIQQVVPIVPERFVVRFRSMTPGESLYIKKLMADEKSGSEQFLLEKYGLLQLTCSVVSINGSDLPHHRKPDGTIDPKGFDAKLEMLLRKPGYIIADLGMNYYWFDIRVRKLLNPEDLKNG